MKTLITLSILIGTMLTHVRAQSVTFQSYMSTTTWVESVLLNGNPINESSAGVFDIPSGDVLPGTNVIEFVSVINYSSNGISTLDIYWMSRVLIGENSLDIEGVIPSDIDKSGYLGVNDIATAYTKVLGINPGVEFAFIHPSVDLASLDPFDFGTDVYKFEFDGADLATTDFTFDVYIHGDVNKSALFAPEGEGEVDVRQSSVYLIMDDMQLTSGSTYEIPFSIESDKLIGAFQLGALMDGIAITDISMDDTSNDLNTNVTEDYARLLVMYDDASNLVEGSFTISVSRDGMLSEFLTQETGFFDEIVYSDLSTAGLEIEFRTALVVGGLSIEDITLSPNPALEEVTISFSEVSSGTRLYISNAQGQLIATKTVIGNSAIIQRDELKTSGVYIITVMQEGQTVQKKFVML